MTQTTLIHKNKKAFFDYEILESWEAGILLKGYEVKALREGKVNLKGSYISLLNNEAFLKECLISPLGSIAKAILDAKTPRKLLLHKKTIDYLKGKIQEAGKTLIPLEIYLSGSLVKVKVALVEGRKKYDKKQLLKERSLDKEAKMKVKEYNS